MAASLRIRLRKGFPAGGAEHAAARDGSLWIATTEGMSHMQNEHFRNYTMADGLSSDRILPCTRTAEAASGRRPLRGSITSWVTVLCRFGRQPEAEPSLTAH